MSDPRGRLKFFLIAIGISMICVTVAASLKQNLADVLPRMIRDPWTMATFVDFYFNILMIGAWMAYKENHPGRAIAWFASFLLLGSIATSFYVLVQLWKLNPGDPLHKILVRSI